MTNKDYYNKCILTEFHSKNKNTDILLSFVKKMENNVTAYISARKPHMNVVVNVS